MGGAILGDVDVNDRGGLGGTPEGGGGATVGMFVENRGTGGVTVEGFRDAISGGAGFDIPDGGGARGGVVSEGKFFDWGLISEIGRCTGRNGGFRKLTSKWLDGWWGGDDSVVCGLGLKALDLGAARSFDVDEVGGLGAEKRNVSGSES